MSLNNLLNNNNFDIHCDNLTCNTMDCGSVVISGISTPGELNLTGGTGVDITATTGTINMNGIINNNSATNVLALNGSSLVYKTNLVDTTSNQTFSNKTLDGTCNVNLSYVNGLYTNDIGVNHPIVFDTSTLSAQRTITWPDYSGTPVFTDETEVLSNKTLDSTCKIQGSYISGLYTSNIITDYPVEFDTSGLTAPHIITFQNTDGVIIYRDTTDTLTNKTILNLVSTGTTDSMLSSKVIRYYFTSSTVGAVASTILSNYSVPLNSCISVEVFANGFCTAGTDINSSVTYNAYLTRVVNIGGTAAASGFLINYVLDSDPGLSTVTITFTTSSSTFDIQVNGVATDSISWSGSIWIYY